MNKFKKRILPILLGAIVTVPTVSVFAKTNDENNTVVNTSNIIKSVNSIGNNVLGNRFKTNLTEEQKSALATLKSYLRDDQFTKEEVTEKLKSLGFALNKSFNNSTENSLVKGNIKSFLVGSKLDGANKILPSENDVVNISLKSISVDSKDLNSILKSFKSDKIDAKEITDKVNAISETLTKRLGSIIKTPLTEDEIVEIKDLKSKLNAGLISKEDAAKRFKELGVNFESNNLVNSSFKLTEEQKETIKNLHSTNLIDARKNALAKLREVLISNNITK